MGDLIVSTPAIKCIRQNFPDAKISLLVRREHQNLLKLNPNLDEIIAFDLSLKFLTGINRLKEEFKFLQLIRGRKFDTVLSLQASDRSTLWAYFSGAKTRVGPVNQGFSFLNNIRVQVYEDAIGYLTYYNKIAEGLQIKVEENKTEFFIEKKTKESMKNNLVAKDFLNSKKLIVIHPGASEPTKIWELKNFLELAVSLSNNYDIVFVKGPSEENILSEILMLNKNNINWVDTSNDVNELAALLTFAELCICNDSGTRHLAAALNRKTLTLFPVDKKVSWNFYNEDNGHYLIYGKRGDEESGKSLKNISVKSVISKVNSIMLNEK